MYKTVSKMDFVREFEKYGRGSQFSSYALSKLYDYLDGDDYELDVIGLCCEFNEVASVEELEEETGCSSERELEHETTVVCFEDDCILYQQF